ncbi:MAG: DUF47 family protein [Magnetococcales bacterium]|nr:DUF47 family protein [Magnetococcales bacterium]NGZ27953.1 DUF47 family protein [Magnetococcales bacterium]
MSGSSGVFAKLLNNVFPRVPDFYGMINEQCDLLVRAADALVEYMETGKEEKSLLVRELEHQGDDLKSRNMDVLNRAFATQMDREDIYRSIASVDMVMNYMKTTVREMELLSLQPDAYTLEIANLLREGCEALKRGYGKLSSSPAMAEEDAEAVSKAERNVEKAYRRAIAELFKAEEQVQKLQAGEANAQAEAMAFVMGTFKRREIYRHMSNAADQMARAGSVLHDIVVQIS